MKSYKTILFDLDGTLTDSGLGIINSVLYSLEKFGITVEDKKELIKFVGPPLSESFEVFYGLSKEEAITAIEYFREYYREKGMYENLVYMGIVPLLVSLKNSGKTLVVATSKLEVSAKQILEHFNLSQYFTYIAGANLDGSRSKKCEVISYALNSCGIEDKNSVIMIGDREHDINGAKAIGIDSIGVLFGYGSYEELVNAEATYIAETIFDIGKILL